MTTRRIVKRTRIGRTDMVYFSAWESADRILTCRARTITYEDGVLFGKIGTDPDPATFADLPAGSDKRIAAAQATYRDRCNLAYRLILEKHPEVADGRRRIGEIVITKGPEL